MLGSCLIGGSILWLSEDQVFPGFNALPPTLGTAMLIGVGRSADPVARLLESRALVGVGLISVFRLPVALAASRVLQVWSPRRDTRGRRGVVRDHHGGSVGELPIHRTSRPTCDHGARSESSSLKYAVPAGVICLIALGVTKTDGFGLRWWSTDYRATSRALSSSERCRHSASTTFARAIDSIPET